MVLPRFSQLSTTLQPLRQRRRLQPLSFAWRWLGSRNTGESSDAVLQQQGPAEDGGECSTANEEDVVDKFEQCDDFREDIYVRRYEETVRDLNPRDWLRQGTAASEEGALAEEEEDAPVEGISPEDFRDVSKLKPWHRMLHHHVPPPMTVYDWQYERRALKERYARFGRASGVNPGVMWPTESELLEKAAVERELEPELFSSLRQLESEREAKEKAREARVREVEANLKAYPKILAEYEGKIQEAEEEVRRAEAEKQRKIREIQEYFGYAVDPGDPRFRDMMAKKEEEERKAKRLAKKLERERKLTAQLQVTAEAVQAADTKNQ